MRASRSYPGAFLVLAILAGCVSMFSGLIFSPVNGDIQAGGKTLAIVAATDNDMTLAVVDSMAAAFSRNSTFKVLPAKQTAQRIPGYPQEIKGPYNSAFVTIDIDFSKTDIKKVRDISYALSTEGHAPLCCETGRDALEMLASKGIGFIILDVGLPDMNGFDLMREIRKTCSTPVLFLTARASEVDRVVGLELGADDYMVKPFSPRELVARVRAHLRRSKKSAKKLMSFNQGLLVLDTENYEARRERLSVVITPMEFRIILALAERPGRVFSRLQLINLVQGYDFEGYDRTIDAHIKNLRHKIEKDPKDPLFIKTVYSVGYKFIGVPDENYAFHRLSLCHSRGSCLEPPLRAVHHG